MKETVPENMVECLLELIHGLRILRCYSQNYVNSETGVDVSKYESGVCLPSLMSIYRLCNLYEIRFAGFWAVLEEYGRKKISFTKAIGVLNQWSEHDQVLRMAIGVITKE